MDREAKKKSYNLAKTQEHGKRDGRIINLLNFNNEIAGNTKIDHQNRVLIVLYIANSINKKPLSTYSLELGE